ncbi:hypothetical protein JRO89_XS07G0265700 [Xanthoceras sorbifolium]|uniref:MADS-box domain-containing protein n=1 Tax=Xanthoceras sorbifolium TaxID=99658 RepID=A0ABQ8HV67_9ROSI|nr:hypothetical protein JRO89_XS07G0265700 [Xanthoceras sorbifolium]
MVRQRIKQELISNVSSRKVTFKKRKGGLLKKLHELTTLCGVIGCAIIYGTFDNRPEIWPSPPEVIHVLDKFNDLPLKRKEKYMVNQKIYLGRSISKLSKWVETERKKNRGLEMELTLTECLTGKSFQDLNCSEDVKDLDLLLEEKIKLINHKIETMDLKSNQVIAQNGNKKS